MAFRAATHNFIDPISGNASFTVTLPTFSTNDLVFIAIGGVSGNQGAQVPGPTGWTNIVNDYGSFGTSPGFQIFRRIMQAGDASTVNFNNTNVSGAIAWAAVSYSSINTTTPIDRQTSVTYSDATNSITTTVVNDILVMFFWENGTSTMAAPSTTTSRVQSQDGGANGGPSVLICDKSVTTATSYGPFTEGNLVAQRSFMVAVEISTTTNISLSRIFKWNVLTSVSPFTRIFKWNVLSNVSLSRIFKWNVIAGVLISRIFIWNVIQTITPVRSFIWNVRTAVTPFTRNFIWDTRLQVSLARSFIWNVIQTILINRVFVWNVRSILSTSRTFLWNDAGRIIIIRSLVWDVYAPWVANVKDCGPWTSINGNTVAWTPEQVNSTSWR